MDGLDLSIALIGGAICEAAFGSGGGWVVGCCIGSYIGRRLWGPR